MTDVVIRNVSKYHFLLNSMTKFVQYSTMKFDTTVSLGDGIIT